MKLALPLALAALAIVPTGPAQAQVPDRPHLRVEVTAADKDQYKALRDSDLDIAGLDRMTFDLLLTDDEHAELAGRGFSTRILEADVYDEAARGGGFLPEYLTYAEVESQLNTLASTYPALTDLSVIGTSLQGRNIYALKISDNVGSDENEPEVLIMACHHAREVISPIIAMHVAETLLTNYGTDPTYTDWVNEREIWVVPIVNPDGYVYVETDDLFWRKNRRNNTGGTIGVDPNRNWSYEWGHDNNGSSGQGFSEVYRGTAPASEPCITTMQNFVLAHDFSVSMSYHSHGNLLLWGPGWKPGIGPDQDVFEGLGTVVSGQNSYVAGNPGNGAIYITNGSSDDWLYNAAGVWAFTPEVGTSSDYFNPPASRIPTLTAEGSICAWEAIRYAPRLEQLAPPGQPAVDAIADNTGTYDVTWNTPTTADTQVVEYELTERTGSAVVTDDVESGSGNYELGGWSLSSVRKFSGSFSLYSGEDDELNRICVAKEGYVVQPGDEFTFRAWYNIEDDWDYAYALLSTDGGRSFTNLAGTNTTMSDPNGNNADNGLTGSSGGWQLFTFDLSAYVGETVWLGFRYYTDAGVTEEGVYIDDIHPVQTWTTSTVLSSTIPGTTYSIAGQPAGTYAYTVRGRDAEGDWGYPSAYATSLVNPSTDAIAVAPGVSFALRTNNPNPFRNRTTIGFSLPSASDHSLTVYDVAGRRVRTLSSGFREAGPHEVVWDGRNTEGNLVPAGVYFYALRADAGELRRRAVLQR